MDKRPELTRNISNKDFKEFYWYKKELIEFCCVEKLDRQAGQIDLTNRIE
ncbi:MAG: hypothetical protein PF541_16845 [Prolixibacteraceae bacterium]|jgi:hypothetical protein|nr:hypothetical protein [Prolixibacteraceae bacterium]